jgi:cytidyltransferase-like protein
MERIYCNGVFDLCHIGHIKQFGQVVVGVHSDVKSYKRAPVQTIEERVLMVKNTK